MNTWGLSWRGLRTVVDLELRQRMRSKRWLVALAVWFSVIGAMTTLVLVATASMSRYSGDTEATAGPMAFGLITLFVLGAGLVIAPAFTATSINGDRNQGTLATLQATPLSTVEIVAGKLVAAWAVAAVFLVAALPFIVWSMLLGGISVVQVLICFAVMFALIAVVCAVGLGFSAMFDRSASSTVMTYVVVASLSVLTLIVPALATVLVTVDNTTVRVYGLPPEAEWEYQQAIDDWYMADQDLDHSWENGAPAGFPAPPVQKCSWHEVTTQVTHTDRVWWMVLPNPFVVVSDAAPLPSSTKADPYYVDLGHYAAVSGDPLAGIRATVREAAIGPETERDDCIWLYTYLGYNVSQEYSGTTITLTAPDGSRPDYVSPVEPRVVTTGTPVWPWGLGANLLLGAFFFWVAVHRLKIPYKRLRKGTRVA